MSTKLFRGVSVAILLAASGAASSVQAQMNSYGLTMTQTMQTMNLSNRLYMLRGRAGGGTRRSGGGTAAPNSSRGNATKIPPTPTTTFRSVAPSIVPQKWAVKNAATPAQRQSMEQMYSELLKDYEAVVRERVETVNDVSRAASSLIAACYFVHHDGRQMTERDFVGVKEQMRRAFLTDDEFQRKSDRERQAMYERFAISGMFILSSYRSLKDKGDERALADVYQMAREQFHNLLGLDIKEARFTSYGIDYE